MQLFSVGLVQLNLNGTPKRDSSGKLLETYSQKDVIEITRALTGWNTAEPEMVTINALAALAMDIAGKRLKIKHVPGPTGVRGRNSDNRLIAAKLGWRPSQPLRVGMESTYSWIYSQVQGGKK